MLTKGDDYPLHQSPDPIAYAGTDRNFYDRYFFNGYTPDGSVFFAVALGVYPHLNIMDAAFSVVVDGVQTSLHTSRILKMERLDTSVGPIAIEVVEPLEALRIRVGKNDSGLAADLLFRARTDPIEEPRFTYRIGPRTIMDYTRLTQNGTYEGSVTVSGRTIALSPASAWGTRDRSWGVRPVGAGDSQPVAPPPPPQFFWLWSPLNFENRASFYHNNANGAGVPWNTHARILPVRGRSNDPSRDMNDCGAEVDFEPGTRRAKAARLAFLDADNRPVGIKLKPIYNFQMCGIGYTHPKWGHGHFKGEYAEGHETWKLSEVDPKQFHNLHVQALCSAEMTDADGSHHKGIGVLEQLIIGPHKPSGFKELLDFAPGGG